MDYRFQIARRYLRSGRSLVSKITAISVTGVAVGVAALIVVLSVMNGFFLFVRDMLVSFDPHVRIVSVEPEGLSRPDSLVSWAMAVDGVVSAAPYVEGKALLSPNLAADVNKVVIVRGVEDRGSTEMHAAVDRTGYGSFDLERRAGRPGIVIGRSLGDRLALTPGGGGLDPSRVSLLSAASIERILTTPMGASPGLPFDVRGLYELQAVFDENYVFVSLSDAQRLFRMGRKVSGIDLRLTDLEQAERVKQELQQRLPDGPYEVRTWYDLQKSLYDVMRLEKWGASLILGLIVLVAAFNIVGSLTMIVIQKRRDVGVLRAMGATRADIRRIFLAEGLLIGAIGSGAGLILGLGLSVLQDRFGLVKLSTEDSFLIDAYPVAIQAGDVAIVAAMALLLCVSASVYPAWRAASIEPSQAVAADG